MKATEKIKDGNGYITIIDETGKHASFTREVSETDPVKLNKLARAEEKRVAVLYDTYDKITKGLLNKSIDLSKAKK